MTGTPDTGDRNARFLCVLRHKKPVEADHGLLVCSHHLAALRETLQDILELYALSRLFLLPGSVETDGSKHTKAAEAPAPIRLDVAALSDRRNPATVAVTYLCNYDESKNLLVQNGRDIPDVPGTLKDHAQEVVDGRGLQALRAGWTITESVRLLQTHIEWVAADPMVEEFDISLRDIRRALALAQGERTVKPLTKAVCGVTDPKTGATCGGALWPADDHCSVRCASCGEVIPPEMLAFLGRQYFDSLPKHLSLIEAAELAGVGHGTIRQWVNRGLILRNQDGTYDREELIEFTKTRRKVS